MVTGQKIVWSKPPKIIDIKNNGVYSCLHIKNYYNNNNMAEMAVFNMAGSNEGDAYGL